MHCRDNVPLDPEDYEKLFAEDGPIAACQAKLDEELAKPLILDETVL